MAQPTLQSIAYLGFNSRVIALDRDTGEVLWKWRSPKGRSSFVALLLDGDRVIVSIRGYTYCLDAITGRQLWKNWLEGEGSGIPCLASLHGSSGSFAAAALLAQQQAAAASAGGGA